MALRRSWIGNLRRADLDAKGEQLTLHFSNANPKLSLDSVWRARAGRGPAEHWLTIANQSDGPITVTQQESLALANLWLPAENPRKAWWINRGGSNASREGGTFTVRPSTPTLTRFW